MQGSLRLQKLFSSASQAPGSVPTVPVSPADSSRLVGGFPSHFIPCAFQPGVFVWNETVLKPFKSKFSIFCSSVVFLGIFLIGFQNQVLGAYLSCAGSRGLGAWCGAWILCSQGKYICLYNLSCLWIAEVGVFFFFPLQRPSLRLLPALLSFFTFCCGDSVHLVFRSLLGRVTPHIFVALLRPWKKMNISPEIFLCSLLIFQLLDSHPGFIIIHGLMKMGKITVTLWDGGKKQL